jgi:hypothetical protein
MKPLTNDELLWVLVDFDNTICNNSGYPDFVPTEPIKGAREALQEIIDKGLKVLVYTARAWSDYSLIEEWLIKNEMPFKTIICGKPLGRVIIDDRAIGFNGDWADVLTKIR